MVNLHEKYPALWADPVMQKTLQGLLSIQDQHNFALVDNDVAEHMEILERAGCLDAVTFAVMITERFTTWPEVDLVRDYFPQPVLDAVEVLNNALVVGHFDGPMLCDFLLSEQPVAARINIARTMIWPYQDMASKLDIAAPFNPVGEHATFFYSAGLFLHMNRALVSKDSCQQSSRGLMDLYIERAQEMKNILGGIDMMDVQSLEVFKEEMRVSFDALEAKWGRPNKITLPPPIQPAEDSNIERLREKAKQKFKL